MSESIPQTAPVEAYQARRSEIDAAINRVLNGGRYILGPEVSAFESEFSAYLGLRHGVGVASGTDAIELALRAVGIRAGDSVFTVSHTAVATVAAIERFGAIPVFIDIDADRYTMDPERLQEAVRMWQSSRGSGSAAVVPVHLYGQVADMPAIMKIARSEGMKVVEDCAQSHGARLGDRAAGTFGDAAAFSFYPTKNLAAIGDGGLVATDDPVVAARVFELRQYGWDADRVSHRPGLNSRLDEIQAAILRVGLKHLDADIARRRAIATQYDYLASSSVRTPVTFPEVEHAFHQYVIRTPRRDDLRSDLARQQIGTGIHYPVPVHRQPAYAGRTRLGGPLSVTERVAEEVLSLPMFPALTDRAVGRVVQAISVWAGEGRVA